MSKYNWSEMGISWNMKSVARRAGPNDSDKVTFPEQGPNLYVAASDLETFMNFAPQHKVAIVDHLDGQSFRVAGDRVLRAYFGKGGVLKGDEGKLEALKERAYESVVLAARAPSVHAVRVQEVRVFNLPNGEKYMGLDLVEYQQLYAASLIDSGVSADIALMIASKQVM